MTRTTYSLPCVSGMAVAITLALGCAKAPDAATRTAEGAGAKKASSIAEGAGAPVAAEPVTLFDGAALGAWKVLDDAAFPGRGGVRVEDGAIVMGSGDPFTGVAWTGAFATHGYEIELQARRVAGNDIFCGLTFPVGDEHVTLVLGGWGNCLVGLSCVDGHNASENITTRAMGFDNGRWYPVAARVTDERIEAWIDDECVVDLERAEHRFTVYDQLLPTRPVGLFTWRTTGEVRDIRLRRLSGPREDRAARGGQEAEAP